MCVTAKENLEGIRTQSNNNIWLCNENEMLHLSQIRYSSFRDIYSTLKCAGPKHLDAIGCAFKLDNIKVITNKASVYFPVTGVLMVKCIS